MNFSILMISISLLSVAVPVVAQPQSGGVKPIVQSGCRQGTMLGKSSAGHPLGAENPSGGVVPDHGGSPFPGQWVANRPANLRNGAKTMCIAPRTRPAYIFPNPAGGGYLAPSPQPRRGSLWL
jgi:hypothetical protein